MSKPRRLPLHVLISVPFLILLLIVGGAIGGLGYSVSRDALESSAKRLSESVGRETLGEFSALSGPAQMATRLLSRDGIVHAATLKQRLARLDFMHEALSHSEELASLYVGYANGDFFLLRRLASEGERRDLAAPAQTAFVVESIEHAAGRARGRFIFLDSALKRLRSDDRPDYAASYDPRSRNWYRQAIATHAQIVTPPYVFFSGEHLGTTIAQRAASVGAVAGADIRLGTIARTLDRKKVTAGTRILMTNGQAQLVVGDDVSQRAEALGTKTTQRLLPLGESEDPLLARLAPLVLGLKDDTAQNVEIDVAKKLWHVSLNRLPIEGSDDLVLITLIPDSELLAAAYTLLRHAGLTMALLIGLAIPLIWTTARTISRPLRKLAGEVDAIRRFELSRPIDVTSPISEVGELAQTIAVMKRTINRFLELTQTVAAESNFDRLLPHLLGETIAAAAADAGILYLVDNQRYLPTAMLMADGSAWPEPAPSGERTAQSPLLARAREAQGACGAALTAADIEALDLAAVVGACRASHAVAVPLLDRKQRVLGAMVLLRHGETDSARLSFIGALSGSAAVSLEAKESIRDQKRLFEGLIELIAGAIDAKSPYTGGHCARVPEIAKRLAGAACAQTNGPYRDFQLDDNDWETLHIAAWLHDCGKVTTPEYIVDKATKLETLYDRIHEIRMRFEVIKRDEKIACLEAIAAGTPAAAAHAALARQWAQLDDDFAFVAACNEGGEFLSEERRQRLHAIAGRTWQRTLDDRLGISRDEAQRKARYPAPKLPADEALLADKPEHRIERDAHDAIAEREQLGIKMPPPELRYNHGELHNLGVVRGTLSGEERYKINEHIVQSLAMLSRLPFPRHLRQVPEIACGHHEKMDGSGYPRRLRGDEMSPLARMMAIADIFEALTAADRPYKKGKMLSEAIAIMARMKNEAHIDPDLFEIFLRAGVHLDYARRFMRAEQIDAVDVAAYLGPAPAG